MSLPKKIAAMAAATAGIALMFAAPAVAAQAGKGPAASPQIEANLANPMSSRSAQAVLQAAPSVRSTSMKQSAAIISGSGQAAMTANVLH